MSNPAFEAGEASGRAFREALARLLGRPRAIRLLYEGALLDIEELVAITRFFCRAQIPIAPPARPRATSRGFVPWRLSDAGPQPRCSRPRPSSAGIRNPSP